MTFNVLFLCTGNSCRSSMAESLLNHLGKSAFHAYSAGSHPAGKVNPNTLKLLNALGHDTSPLRSKNWDEFAEPGAPEMDFIVTTCDNAAGEVCPIWPGHPTTAHWPFPDPAPFQGGEEETREVYLGVYRQIEECIQRLIDLAAEGHEKDVIAARLQSIGPAS